MLNGFLPPGYRLLEYSTVHLRNFVSLEMTRLGFGGPLNIKFKILLYEKSVLGLHDEDGWLHRRVPRCRSDSNSNSSVRSL